MLVQWYFRFSVLDTNGTWAHWYTCSMVLQVFSVGHNGTWVHWYTCSVVVQVFSDGHSGMSAQWHVGTMTYFDIRFSMLSLMLRGHNDVWAQWNVGMVCGHNAIRAQKNVGMVCGHNGRWAWYVGTMEHGHGIWAHIPFAAIDFSIDRLFLLFSVVVSTCCLCVSILSEWVPEYLRWFIHLTMALSNVTADIALPAALSWKAYRSVCALLGLIWEILCLGTIGRLFQLLWLLWLLPGCPLSFYVHMSPSSASVSAWWYLWRSARPLVNTLKACNCPHLIYCRPCIHVKERQKH